MLSRLAEHSCAVSSPAADPSDFQFNPVRLDFNPGETYKEFVVPVADDEDNLEPDEQFILNLVIIAVGGSSSNDVQNTTVTIIDDKCKHCQVCMVVGVSVTGNQWSLQLWLSPLSP